MTKLLESSESYYNLVNVPLVREVQNLLDSTAGSERALQARVEAIRRLRAGGLAHSLAAEAARYAILHDASASLSRAEDLATAAGQLFLRSARLAELRDDEMLDAARDRLESSLEFLAGHRPAIAAAVARPAVAWLESLARPPDNDEGMALQVLQMLARALAGGGMPSERDFTGTVESTTSQRHDVALTSGNSAEGVLAALSTLIGTIGGSLHRGELDTARATVANFARAAADLERFVNGEISDLILRYGGIISFLIEHSAWKIPAALGLGDPSVAQDLVLHMLRQRRFFLFPAQMSALNTPGLMSTDRSHIISMPTGSGKTLLGAFILLRHVLESLPRRDTGRRRVFYLVPSRALAKEKVEELRSLFRSLPTLAASVCQLTGDLILNADDAIRNFDVIVATPEKFDMLLRVPALRPAVGAVLVDEFHNIRADARGLRLLVALARLRRQPETAGVPLHLISAIVRPADLGKVRAWLDRHDKVDAPTSVEFQSQEPPLFIRTGVFDFKEEQKSTSWKIRYDDGSSRTVLPARHKGKRLTLTQHRRAAEHLAITLREEGPTLLFATAAQWRWDSEWGQWTTMPIRQAVDISGMALSLPSWVDASEHQNFVKQLAKLLGPEHRLVDAARRGVTAHWGGLPVRARRLVERAVLQRAVTILIATSTLAEGVNLPFKRIIISKCDIAGRPFDTGFFLNLKGRVGRPFLTEEGEVILIKGHEPDAALVERLRRATAGDVEPLASPVVRMTALRQTSEGAHEEHSPEDKAHVQYGDMMESLDTAILAIIAEHEIARHRPEDELSSFIALDPGEVTHSWLDEIVASISRLSDWKLISSTEERLTTTEFGKKVYESGFPPGSAFAARNSLKRADLDAILKVPNSPTSGASWNFLLSICEILSRTGAWTVMKRVGIKSSRQAALYAKDWAQGLLLKDIARERKGDRLHLYSVLEGSLAPLLAWFIFSLSLWLSDQTAFPKVSPEVVQRLQAWSEFLWFGAPPSQALALLKHDFAGRLFRDDILVLEQLAGPSLWERLRNPQDSSSDRHILERLEALQDYTVDSAEYLFQTLRELFNSQR